MSIWYHFPWARGNALVRIWPGDTSTLHWLICPLIPMYFINPLCSKFYTQSHYCSALNRTELFLFFSGLLHQFQLQPKVWSFIGLQLKYLNIGKDYISSSTCLIVGLRKKIFTILFNKIIFSSGRGKTASWRGISSWDDGSTSPLQSPSPSSSWTVTGEILRGNVKGY